MESGLDPQCISAGNEIPTLVKDICRPSTVNVFNNNAAACGVITEPGSQSYGILLPYELTVTIITVARPDVCSVAANPVSGCTLVVAVVVME